MSLKLSLSKELQKALLCKDEQLLRQVFMRIFWKKFDLQEICCMEGPNGKSPLRVAVTEAKGDVDMLKMLRQHDVKLDVVFGVDEMTILHLAVIAQDKAVLEYLISKSIADINKADRQGRTALHYAIQSKSPSICAFLLKKEIDVNAQDSDGKTALHLAVNHLIENADQNGNSPVHLLVSGRPIELVKKLEILLKDRRYKLQMKNNEGLTAWDIYARHENCDPTHPDFDPIEYELIHKKLTINRHLSLPNNLSEPNARMAFRRASEMNPTITITQDRTQSLPRTSGSRMHMHRRSSSNLLDLFSRGLRRMSLSPSRRGSRASNLSNVSESKKSSAKDDGDSDDAFEPYPDAEECKRRAKALGEMYQTQLCRQTAEQKHNGKHDEENEEDDDVSSFYTESSFRSTDSQHDNSRAGSPKYNASDDSDESPGPTESQSEATGGDQTDGKRINDSTAADEQISHRTSTSPVIDSGLTEDLQIAQSCSNASANHSKQEAEVVNNNTWKPLPPPPPLSTCDSDTEASYYGSSPVRQQKISTATLVGEVRKPSSATVIHMAISSMSGDGSCVTSIPDTTTTESRLHRYLADCAEQMIVDTLNSAAEAAVLTSIKELARENEEEVLEKLKSSDRMRLLSIRDELTNESLLHIAVQRGSERTLEYLLEVGLDINATDYKERTPLHIAAELSPSKLHLLKTLLNHGAARDRYTLDGETPFNLAVNSLCPAALNALLTDYEPGSQILESVLYQIIRSERKSGLMNPIKKHIDSHCSEDEVHKIVPLSAKNQHWSLLKYIVTKKLQRKPPNLCLDKRDEDGWAAVHYCALYGKPGLLRQLDTAGADLRRLTRKKPGPRTTRNPPKTARSIAESKGLTQIAKLIDQLLHSK